MTYSARVMAEDRLLSEAMDQRAVVCGEAAESVGLLEVVTALVERAKARASCAPTPSPGTSRADLRHRPRRPRARPGRPALTWERHLEIILAGLRAA